MNDNSKKRKFDEIDRIDNNNVQPKKIKGAKANEDNPINKILLLISNYGFEGCLNSSSLVSLGLLNKGMFEVYKSHIEKSVTFKWPNNNNVYQIYLPRKTHGTIFETYIETRKRFQKYHHIIWSSSEEKCIEEKIIPLAKTVKKATIRIFDPNHSKNAKNQIVENTRCKKIYYDLGIKDSNLDDLRIDDIKGVMTEFLPKSLRKLKVTGELIVDKFPPHLSHLTINGVVTSISKPVLPDNLVYFDFTINTNYNFLKKFREQPSMSDLFREKSYNSLVELYISNVHWQRDMFQSFKNLKKLTIMPDSIKNIVPDLPISLEYIDIELYDNICPVKFHEGVIDLSLSGDFTTSINNLPSTLKKLSLLCDVNQSIGLIPRGLTHITITGEFNGSVDNLPKGLVYLKIRGAFNRSVDKLPDNLQTFKIRGEFNQEVNKLPNTLHELHIHSRNFKHNLNNLPSNLHILNVLVNFDNIIGNLPINLKCLMIEGSFNQPLNKLPSGLFKLQINGAFDQTIDALPDKLEILILRKMFNKPIDNLPKSLKILNISGVFNQTIDNLPSSVESIDLAGRFNQRIKTLPHSLRILRIYRYKDVRSYFTKSNIDIPYTLGDLKLPPYLLELKLNSTENLIKKR